MTERYILNEAGEPVQCPDLMTWAKWIETSNRRVAFSEVGDAEVSTVFLGIDHQWVDGGPPLLFESLVFGGPRDGDMRRYSTRDEALAGHAEIVGELEAAP